MYFVSTLKITTAAAVSLLLLACNPAKISGAPQISNQNISANEIVQPWVSEDAPGVSVAVSHNGEVVFARGAGLANIEHRQRLSPDSVFQVASVSKQFTAFAALLLVSEGKIDLDEDIRTYIPELAQNGNDITLRHLLNHTSGLREVFTLNAMAGWLSDDIQTHDHGMEMIYRQQGGNFDPGAEVQYSNTGYLLIAEMVARVSEKPFETFVSDRIFEPLGMSNTRIGANRNDLIIGRASSYYPSDDGYKNVLSVTERVGSTGVYTTALDLLKWAENFQTRRVGDDTVFALMEARAAAENGDASTFAKGQELRPYRGLQTWSHGGRDVGYRSFVLRIPEEDFALSILSNRTDFDTAKMAFALVDAFFKDSKNYVLEEEVVWTPASQEELSQYVGRYEIQPASIFDIRVDAQGLRFADINTPKGEGQLLPQTGPRQFSLNPSSDISLVFGAPAQGKSETLRYKIGLHGTIGAKRVLLDAFDPSNVDLSDYVGLYESQELGTSYTLTLKKGELMAKHYRLPAFSIAPYQDDVFSGQGPLGKLEFTRGENGEVTSMKASSPLANNVHFERK